MVKTTADCLPERQLLSVKVRALETSRYSFQAVTSLPPLQIPYTHTRHFITCLLFHIKKESARVIWYFLRSGKKYCTRVQCTYYIFNRVEFQFHSRGRKKKKRAFAAELNPIVWPRFIEPTTQLFHLLLETDSNSQT